MQRKIFVGNLPLSIDDKNLFELFAKIDEVESAKVILGIDGKISAGYGYVIMRNDKGVANSIKKLNNSNVKGNTIRVMEAHPIDQDRSFMFRRYNVKRDRR